MRRIILLFAFACLGVVGTAVAQELPASLTPKVLTLDEFIPLAIKNDTEFEKILIEELTLQYQKALKLPAKDLVLSVKQQHEFFLDQGRDSPDTTVSLSKVFPHIGTSIDAAYEAGTSVTSADTSSSLTFGISQPIAQNAFGRSTRMLDKIVGLEVDIARYQVVEAYEDYMAVILTAYYDWYADYENLNVGRSSYQTNVKLLDNIYERQRQKIALPIDVNKVKFQVTAKEERVIELEEQCQSSFNVIKRIIRRDDKEPIIPSDPRAMAAMPADFETAFADFQRDSRTFAVLHNLEEKSDVQVERDADALLPSIDLLLGYEVSGKKYTIENENNMLYAGVQLDWPFNDQVDRAEYEIAKIMARSTKVDTTNTYYRIYTQMHNLYLQMEREQKLIKTAEERISLANAVLEDEAENYSFGKVSLNDYIQAVNALDTNRFNKITHEVLYKKLLVEWLRLSDKLVQFADVTRIPQ